MDNRFQEVWNRVTASGTADDQEKLHEFIMDERKDAAEYAKLAKCTGSMQVKRLFSKLSAEEHEHLRRLTAAAYLLVGNTYPPVGDIQAIACGNTLQALRHRYEAEKRGAEAYEAAAGSAGNRQLRSLYAELAEDERRHGNMLWDLLKRMM